MMTLNSAQHLRFETILDEIRDSLTNGNYDDIELFIEKILSSQTIVCYGAGRVGYALKGFTKRLGHLGLRAYFLEDTAVPATAKGDLLLIGSGSGETPTTKTIAEVALSHGLEVALVTASPNSTLAKLACCKLVVIAPSKGSEEVSVHSVQPMTSLFEQSLLILLDAIVLKLMEQAGESSLSMKLRHNVIE